MNDAELLANELGPQGLDQPLVDLDTHNFGARVQQPSSERPEPWTDLDDMITVANAGQPDNTIDLVGVDEEVLTQRLVRVQPEPFEQLGGGFRSVTQSRCRPQLGQGWEPWSSNSLLAILS